MRTRAGDRVGAELLPNAANGAAAFGKGEGRRTDTEPVERRTFRAGVRLPMANHGLPLLQRSWPQGVVGNVVRYAERAWSMRESCPDSLYACRSSAGVVSPHELTTVSSGFEMRLFGPFTVLRDGQPLPPLRTRKGQSLLALLVLRAGRAVERPWLAGVLWPESPEAQARYNLRRSLSDLRQALGSEAVGSLRVDSLRPSRWIFTGNGRRAGLRRSHRARRCVFAAGGGVALSRPAAGRLS